MSAPCECGYRVMTWARREDIDDYLSRHYAGEKMQAVECAVCGQWHLEWRTEG